MSDTISSSGVWTGVFLGGVLLLAVALRLINLGHSYWIDEDATLRLLQDPFLFMIRHGIARSESTPPLYYTIAWLWSHVFGTSEAAVRSLTALIGVATVAVSYAIGVELRSRSAGLILAALAAVSPLMVWYSQDARAYDLVILLTSVSLLFFAQALRTRSAKSIWLWALASAAALTAHYFSIFVLVPEAVALLVSRNTRSRAVWPTALVAGVWFLLLPLLLFQRTQPNHLSWIPYLRLPTRLELTLQFYDVGSWHLSLLVLLAVTALIAGVIGGALFFHRIHRRELVILGVGASGIGLPIIASLAGVDYVNYQNLVVGWMPFAAVLAVALAASRKVGILVAVALCSAALVATVKIQTTPSLQRQDWRAAAKVLSGEPSNSLFVVYPAQDVWALKWYAHGVSIVKCPTLTCPDFRSDPQSAVRTRRLVLLAEDPWVYSAAHTLAFHAPPGFHETSETSFSTFVLITYTAAHAVPVSVDRLSSMRPSGYLLGTTPWTSSVFLDRHVTARS